MTTMGMRRRMRRGWWSWPVAGCAVRRAGAALRVAATSAASSAGRINAIFSDWGLAAGGCRRLVAI